jgi:hypothetical protein
MNPGYHAQSQACGELGALGAANLDGEWDTATISLARAYQSVLDACATSDIPS